MSSEAHYRRALNGITVHRAACARATSAVPWKYADGMDSDAICLVLANYAWLRPCKVCRPDAARSTFPTRT